MRSLQPGRLLHDERGQSVQVGAAILLGFVVIAITMYQVQVVPDQNEEIEFNHNQEVQGEMADLRDSIVNADDRSHSTSVTLGTRYPARTIFVNPPPSQGTLKTTDLPPVRIENAQTAGTNSDEATDILNGAHATAGIEYEPRYTEFDSSPATVIENGLLYNAFDSDYVDPDGNQSIVDGDTISIPIINGSLQEQGIDSASVTTERISGPSGIQLRGEGGANPTVVLPTKQPVFWEEHFNDVSGVNATAEAENDTVRVELTGEEEYTLELTRVHVGQSGDTTPEGNEFDGPDSSSGDENGLPPTIDDLSWDDGESVTIHRDDPSPPDLEFSTSPKSNAGSSQATVTNSSIGTLGNYTTEFQDGGGEFQFEPHSIGSTTVSVDAGGRRDELTVNVVGNGSVEGTVTDENGDAIQGANVEVERENGVVSATTDPSGQYTLEDVPGGDREVTVEATDYEPQTQTVHVEHEQTSTADFVLEEIEGAWFDVDITDVSTSIEEEDTATVTADIENIGTATDTQEVGLDITDAGGSTVFTDQQSVELTPGDPPETITFEWTTEEGDSGEYDATVSSDQQADSAALQIDEPAESRVRVDDLTNMQTNSPRFYVSYDIAVPHDEVEIVAESTEDGPGDSETSHNARGGVNLQMDSGTGQEFDITVRAMEDGSLVFEETLTTSADTHNPSNNDDMANADSVDLESENIIDDSDVSTNTVRYEFDYRVSENGGFSQAELLALSRNGSGGSEVKTETVRSGTTVPVEPSSGADTMYKVGILVKDSDGVVVREIIREDIAEGETDP